MGILLLLLWPRSAQPPPAHSVAPPPPASTGTVSADSTEAPPQESPVPASAPQPMASLKPVAEWTWFLSNPTVTSPGQVKQGPEGRTFAGFALTADVSGDEASVPFRRGRLEVRLAATCPEKSARGEKPEVWHLAGEWAILDAEAPKTPRRGRRNSSALAGKVSADLPFNPLAGGQPFVAALSVPYSVTGPRGRSTGQWSADGSFGGTFTSSIGEATP